MNAAVDTCTCTYRIAGILGGGVKFSWIWKILRVRGKTFRG